MLESSGTTMAYILCSWVRGSSWLCHRGTFDDRGKLDDRNPFDERNLVQSSLCLNYSVLASHQ